MPRTFSLALVATALTFGAHPVRAQGVEAVINPYFGFYHFDQSSFEEAFDESDVDGGLIYGARLGIESGTFFSWDLAYGRASADGEITIGGDILPEDSGIHIFYGAVNYGLPPPVRLFLSGGVGAIRYSPEDRDARTDFLVNYGGGVSVDLGRMRFRADAKDHIDLCEADPDDEDFFDFGACFEDDALHNIELSAGVEIEF